MEVEIGGRRKHLRTVTFDARGGKVRLLDQRKLPHRVEIFSAKDFHETAWAIREMVTRGAGAIGATAAYGLAQGAVAFRGAGVKAFLSHIKKVFAVLKEARPTAVDPVNAMLEVMSAMDQAGGVEERKARGVAAAEAFAERNVEECRALGQHGEGLIREGMRILTHCNAGWLAFVDVGSATAPLYAAQEKGRAFHVFCDETRPRFQGATLTAWELANQGISHTVIADNAAGHLMQRGEIDLVIVGSDRVLVKTGEVANKIGTYTKAVLARRHGIPFYVAIPLSTLDGELESGLAIPIEERSEEEVLFVHGVDEQGRRRRVRVANPSSPARNPGFDVTPPELITGIITPMGIYKPGEIKRLWKRLQGNRTEIK